MASPLSLTGRLWMVAVQSLSAFSTTDWPLLRVTVREAGRLPSWLSASSQFLTTVRLVVAEAWALVTVKPLAASPVMEVV